MVTPFLTNIVLTDEVGGSSFKVCIEVHYHCEDRALVQSWGTQGPSMWGEK